MSPTKRTWPVPAPAAALLGAALACAAAVTLAPQTETWWPAPLAWMVSWSLLIVAAWSQDRRHDDHHASGQRPGAVELAVIAALLAIGLGLRVHALGELPVQLHNDEMSCGIAARQFLGSQPPSLFATGWAWCPTLGYALTSLPMRMLGATVVGLRASSVALGLVSLIGLYLLVRTSFGRRAALLAVALTVPYHWHLHLSRTGFHYIQAATATVWTLALVALGLRSRRLAWFAAAGVCLGFGLQTYYAARLTPVIVMAWLGAAAWLGLGRRRLIIAGLGVTVLAAIVTCAPVIRHFVEQPHDLTARTADVFVFGPHAAKHVAGLVGSSDRWDILVYQIIHVARAPFSGGDTSIQYRFRGPLVPRPLQLPFVLGMLLGALEIWRGWRRRCETDDTPRRVALGHLGLWLWIVGTLVVGGVLTIDPPFSPRLSGLALAFMVPPAVAFEQLLTRPRPHWLRATATILVVGWIGVAGWDGWRAYFVDYPRYAPVSRRDRITRVLLRIGDVRTAVSLLDSHLDLEHQTYRFATPAVVGVDLGHGATGRLVLDGLAHPVLIVLEEHDSAAVELVRQLPEAEYHWEPSHNAEPGFAWMLVR